MKKFKVQQRSTLISLILVVFCFFAAVLGVFVALGHVFSKAQHEKKWSDYDECGIF